MKSANDNPLVSVIVPTKDSAEFLEACLKSIRSQSYKNIELLVVDNFSTDTTPKIAHKYAHAFFSRGPERSSQRNYGVFKSKGTYVAIIDSDMELDQDVIADCVKAMSAVDVSGVIIPEQSFGEGFWAQCKQLEKSFYVGVDWMEAARFFSRKDYRMIGGYNDKLVSGEDWDLSHRIKKLGHLAHVPSFIHHNEGHISLLKTLRKKSYYASQINRYVAANTATTSTGSEILRVFKRFGLYFSDPIRLLKNPLVGLGMLMMKIIEFGVGGYAYYTAKFFKVRGKRYCGCKG